MTKKNRVEQLGWADKAVISLTSPEARPPMVKIIFGRPLPSGLKTFLAVKGFLYDPMSRGWVREPRGNEAELIEELRRRLRGHGFKLLISPAWARDTLAVLRSKWDETFLPPATIEEWRAHGYDPVALEKAAEAILRLRDKYLMDWFGPEDREEVY